jgi:endo-1,4-beta-xylanase
MKKRAFPLIAICLVLLFTTTALAEDFNPLSLPSLKDFYADYFDFGSAVNGSEINDTKHLPFFAAQYSIVTHENELKPENVIDIYNSKKVSAEDQGSVALQFYTARPLLDFAWNNGLKVHGHVLFWHSQTPDVFFRESYASSRPYVSREVMLERMENYVRITMEYMEDHYPGLVVSWDVVNEAIDDATGTMRESIWTKVVGDDFVIQAFRLARKYAPEGTLLFYNDYSTPYHPKLTGILSLLDDLIAEDLVDGYGFQCHYQMTTPSNAQLRSAIQKIVNKGVLIRVSELDILVDSNSDAQFEKQADRYKSIMEILLSQAEHITAVVTWGTYDSRSWKSSSYPLLFNGDGTPKPAFYTLTNPDILP